VTLVQQQSIADVMDFDCAAAYKRRRHGIIRFATRSNGAGKKR